MTHYTLWNHPPLSAEERKSAARKAGFTDEMLDGIANMTTPVHPADISDRLNAFDTKFTDGGRIR